MEKFETISEDMLESVSGGGRGGKGHHHHGILSHAVDFVGDVVGGALKGLGGLLSGLGSLPGGRRC